MGALGDYVHMLYRNYQRYGVEHYGVSSGQPLSNVINNYIRAMDNRINDDSLKVKEEDIVELERRLKLNSNQSLEKSQNEWANKQQQYLDQIYTILFERSKDVSGVSSGVERVYQISQGQHFVTKKGRTMNLNVEGQHWASSKSLQELQTLKKEAQKKYNEIQSLITKINTSQNQSSQDLNHLIQLYKQYTHLTLDPEEHTLGAIEKALGEHRYDNIASNIGGTFGEMFVAICDDRAYEKAVQSANDFIEQNVKGSQKSAISFEKSLISGKRGDKFFKTDPNNNTSYLIGATQDKVDVEIKVNNSDIFASVKSYSGTDIKSVHPHLQNVNLFYTLTFLNSFQQFKDIGNHWLNIHSSHEDREKRVVNKDLNDIIKKEVALQALSMGNPFKKNINKANVFIYINRTTGQVYVKSVNDIITKQFESILGLDAISSIYLDNHKSQKFEDRITNVLNQLHQQNISVQLNVKI